MLFIVENIIHKYKSTHIQIIHNITHMQPCSDLDIHNTGKFEALRQVFHHQEFRLKKMASTEANDLRIVQESFVRRDSNHIQTIFL